MHLWPVANWYLLLFILIEYMNLTAKYFLIILDLETLMFTNTRSQVDSTLIFSSRFDKILYTIQGVPKHMVYDVNYFPKDIFPNCNFPRVFSEVDIFKICPSRSAWPPSLFLSQLLAP